MPAGIIRGALARIGYQAAVVPEVTALPQCMYYAYSLVGPLVYRISRYIPSQAAKGRGVMIEHRGLWFCPYESATAVHQFVEFEHRVTTHEWAC